VTGLLYGGGWAQLKAQVIGSATVTVATFAVAMVLMYAVKATGTLRVSKDGELEGLDLHEHGGHAYPEHLVGVSSPASEPVAAPAPALAHETALAER
jgi:Amt family ammonium transporter